MKNKLTIVMMVLVLLMSTNMVVFADASLPFEISDMKVGFTVDGEIVNYDEGDLGRIFVTNNSVSMTPLRIVAETLGYDVKWLPETQEVLVSKGDEKVTFKIGSYKVTTANGVIEFREPIVVIDGRTYLEIRGISEVFGYKVGWESFKNIKGANQNDKDFYVTIESPEGSNSNTNVGFDNWSNVHEDEATKAILAEASDETKVYNQAGVIKVGSDTQFNRGWLTIYTSDINTVTFQITGYNQPMVKSTLKSFLNLWTPDGDEIYNQFDSALNGTDIDAMNMNYVTATNGTIYTTTGAGDGVSIIIKK